MTETGYHPPLRARQAPPVVDLTAGQTPFEVWMQKVDYELERWGGLTTGDLDDCCYRDWYDSGMGPNGAAELALENSGWDESAFDLDDEMSY